MIIESALTVCNTENIDDEFVKIDSEKMEEAKIAISNAIFSNETIEGDVLTILLALKSLVNDHPDVSEYRNTLAYIEAHVFQNDEEVVNHGKA